MSVGVTRARPSVFISYKRSETEHLVTELFKSYYGIVDIMYDQMFLVAGESWWNQIVREINRADVYAIIISASTVIDFQSTTSPKPACVREFEVAVNAKKHVIPILWERPENIERLPATLTDTHQLSFEEYRMSGMSDRNAFDRAAARLVSAIHADANAWIDESMRWYERLSLWDHQTNRRDQYLLTTEEIAQIEDWVRRRPKNMSLAPEHPHLWEFIDASKQTVQAARRSSGILSKMAISIRDKLPKGNISGQG